MRDFREAFGAACNAGTAWSSTGGWELQAGAISRATPLGALLWRIKYGGDMSTQLLTAAVDLLAEKVGQGFAAVRRRRINSNGGVLRRRDSGARTPPMVRKFAAIVLGEWIADRCPICRGRGTLGSIYRGTPGPAAADPGFLITTCQNCNGTGRRPVRGEGRAVALGVSWDLYVRLWADPFDAWLRVLDLIDQQVNAAVFHQLRAVHGSVKVVAAIDASPFDRTGVSPPRGQSGPAGKSTDNKRHPRRPGSS